MLFIIEGIDLELLIQIFKGFNSTLPRPAGFSNFCGAGQPFFPRGGAHIPELYTNPNLRKGDAIMQCVETSLMKCPDPTPSNLVHGLLKAMKAGTPCGAAAQGWHTGGSDRFRLGIAAILVTVLRFSLWSINQHKMWYVIVRGNPHTAITAPMNVIGLP